VSGALAERLAEAGRSGHRSLAAGVVDGGVRDVAGWAADGPAPGGGELFEIGSVTKAFTGVLLADMTLRGEVALGDSLSRHLVGPRPAWRHREPTLLELATHRSGLPNTPRPLLRRELAFGLGLRRGDPWAGVDAASWARLVAAESPRHAPGGRVRYSSLGVGLLGDALAARAGRPYEDLLRERVLAPLGLTCTFVTVPPAAAPRLLGGHSRRGRPRPPLSDHLAPAGSLRSTAADVLRFLTACVAPPADPPGPALALAARPHARINGRMAIGLCWVVSTPRGRPPVVWHNGGTWGFRSWAGFCAERETAAVVLANTARGVDRLGFALLDGAGSG
jgi:CubicO group peptidase (beta-lactamase class C family)